MEIKENDFVILKSSDGKDLCVQINNKTYIF